jgi:CopG family nickel-responsive transcriptional regulator
MQLCRQGGSREASSAYGSSPTFPFLCGAISVTTSELVRFGVSIDGDLLGRFDKQIERKGYTNRSEAIRDLIRDNLVSEEWAEDAETVGTITVVYDHHTPDLNRRMTHIQHSFTGEIKSVLHIHMDHHNCLEVLVVQGQGQLIKSLSDQLISLKGVKHGKLTMTTTGKSLPSRSGHHREHDIAHGHSHEHEHDLTPSASPNMEADFELLDHSGD